MSGHVWTCLNLSEFVWTGLDMSAYVCITCLNLAPSTLFLRALDEKKHSLLYPPLKKHITIVKYCSQFWVTSFFATDMIVGFKCRNNNNFCKESKENKGY